jgi:hypothetical protein
MIETYESILEAARRLPPEQQRQLALLLLALPGKKEAKEAQGGIETLTALREARRKLDKLLRAFNQQQATAEPRSVRRHFGAWDSGDERSADNERIDCDLARSYGDSHKP